MGRQIDERTDGGMEGWTDGIPPVFYRKLSLIGSAALPTFGFLYNISWQGKGIAGFVMPSTDLFQLESAAHDDLI